MDVALGVGRERLLAGKRLIDTIVVEVLLDDSREEGAGLDAAATIQYDAEASSLTPALRVSSRDYGGGTVCVEVEVHCSGTRLGGNTKVDNELWQLQTSTPLQSPSLSQSQENYVI